MRVNSVALPPPGTERLMMPLPLPPPPPGPPDNALVPPGTIPDSLRAHDRGLLLEGTT